MLLRNQDGSIIGVLKKGVLTKKVHSRVHKLRIIDGYAIDKYSFDMAVKNGAEKIKIVETDAGKVFIVGIKDFERDCKEFDFGHGKLLALAGRYWKLEAGQESLL